MAEQPTNMNEQEIQETLGEAEYMPPAGEIIQGAGHYDNLLPLIDVDQANALALNLCADIEMDMVDHEPHDKKIDEGLACFAMDGGVKSDTDDEDDDLEMVKHVLLEEACTHAQGRALMEINPAEGPVKFNIVAEATDEQKLVQQRATEYMNWQLKHQVPGWNQVIDKMLNHLVIGGTAALKVTWDPVWNRPDVEFVPAKNLIVSSDTDSLASSKRYSHRYFLTMHEYLANCDYGVYSLLEGIGNESHDREGQNVGADVEGTQGTDGEESNESNRMLTFIDVFTYASFTAPDGMPLEPYEGNATECPYVITIDKGSNRIVSIRRNWNHDDPKKKPIQCIYEFRFFPSLNFWGFGFYDKIGGLDKAATAALRGNLKAAALKLNPPRITSAPGLPSGKIKLSTGLVISSKRSSADDITKNIHEIPIMPPDATMLALMQDMSENARRYANTTDFQIGELGKAGTPAATTLALIEQGKEAQTTIHKRIHADFQLFLKELQRLNYLYLPPQTPFTTNGVSQIVFNTDFDPRSIDIIPYSDPNVASDTQRIMQTQELVQMAMANPQLLDLEAAYLAYMKAIKIPNPEEFLIKGDEPPLLDSASENDWLMNGRNVAVHPEDDDAGHILSHMTFLNDPSLANNQIAGDVVKMPLIIHIRQHIAQYYRKHVSASIGIPIGTPTDPQTTALIQMRVTELMSQSPTIHSLQALMMGTGDAEMEMTVKLAELDYQIKQLEMQDERTARQQKMLDDAQARRDKMDTDRQAILIRAETEASVERQNHALKIRNMELQYNNREQIAVQSAVNEEQRKNKELVDEMRREWIEHEQKLREEREMFRVEMEKKVLELEAERDKLRAAKEKLQVELRKNALTQNKKVADEVDND